MTNAVEPITGGNSTPPVEAHASMPPAADALKPDRFIAGIVNCPVVNTFVTTLPLIDPIRPLERIATFAGPPRTRPKSENARSMKNCPPPVHFKATPNTRKPMTRFAKARNGNPSTLSLLIAWYIAVSCRETDMPEIASGICSAASG